MDDDGFRAGLVHGTEPVLLAVVLVVPRYVVAGVLPDAGVRAGDR